RQHDHLAHQARPQEIHGAGCKIRLHRNGVRDGLPLEMIRARIALGIRAQLLLVLTVFLAIPWLGYEYVRELERFLRDSQERTVAGTAQAVATALHDRPRLFATAVDPIASFAQDRAQETSSEGPLPPSASPEIAQIVQG